MYAQSTTVPGVPDSLALGGFMGVGKSTVGVALARALSLPFVDLDELLITRHGEIRGQIELEGERVFREREREAIASCVDGVPRVLATGGGAWVDPRNRATLRQQYRLVVLDAPFDVIAARLGPGASGDRPLWSEARARYEARREAYADADLHVNAAQSPERVVQEVLDWLGK